MAISDIVSRIELILFVKFEWLRRGEFVFPYAVGSNIMVGSNTLRVGSNILTIGSNIKVGSQTLTVGSNTLTVGSNEVRGRYIVRIRKVTVKPYVRDENLFSIALMDTWGLSRCFISNIMRMFVNLTWLPTKLSDQLSYLSTLPYLINVHGRLLFSEKISRVDALI